MDLQAYKFDHSLSQAITSSTHVAHEFSRWHLGSCQSLLLAMSQHVEIPRQLRAQEKANVRDNPFQAPSEGNAARVREGSHPHMEPAPLMH